MQWLMVLLIALASSIDNLAVGLSYGIQGKKITNTANGLMAAIALVMSLLALFSGRLIGYAVPESAAGILSGTIILFIGLWTLAGTFRRKKSSAKILEANQVDKDHNNVITSNEVIWLSIALSLNAVGAAFGAGVAGLNPYWVLLSVCVLSFISVSIGQSLGLKGHRSNLGSMTELIAAAILIVLGMYTVLSPFI
ncbi:hypothetical protein EWI07_00595 [Sporolactobacillus sp. THM7-4]|nr:hypothetical protein EWI07_00595 [Sporolactobacillus sp. THM7-4]